MNGDNVTLQRLNAQIEWYDQRSMRCQRYFKVLKGITMVAAATVPFAAGMKWPALVTGLLGVVIVIVEGFQQLNQYQHNWITYRSTCEALKHEKYLFHASAGPYSDCSEAKKTLAERVESLVSQEHAKWVSTHECAGETRKGMGQNG